ncbi:type IV pili methyl-accepting chemotaxis transducer N-terminal domain-containing protein [Pusillimonas sp. MFBS29]|uniref:type IV pili methyl-accepting chemotaxis transducer N-terminal domain-containing protein n=1 Tax=Pusillimonas sp. MFBS29 TaxID=2886690 RepID=UPI001D11C10F|nr:type IV pili methyl-accepting chemotaxis transducer N-terminal domain-containing protein [Pusillimonas sp. MFBS29]MCC2596820.1 type IV pili methyl-accepting chemotaxis transducer N-terminal domain-containing protein [Pusillimonas sp. MFBS29]
MNDTTVLSNQPALRDRLSTRIIASSAVALVVVLSMIAWTLWLSWQMEGAGAAINDAGSLRMRANLVAVELAKAREAPVGSHGGHLHEQITIQEGILTQLVRGNPARPLFLPEDPAVLAQMDKVAHMWEQDMVPAALQSLNQVSSSTYLQILPDFVMQADKLVSMLEADSSSKLSLLRLTQGILSVIAGIGTLTMIYLLYLWIIFPILRLGDGLRSMAARQFGVRLPVETQDEFGVLASGFNRMADELEDLYGDLEARVLEKTAQLAEQNQELGALYDITAFLNQPNEIEDMCGGFLDRVIQQFGAGGGTIRTLDPKGEHLTMVVSRGLSDAHDRSEHCMKVGGCFCGTATRNGILFVDDIQKAQVPTNFQCAKEGFRSLAVFRIQAQKEVLGSFSLHFRDTLALSNAERHLLETLGQHLGVALENRRLSAVARKLAMVHERNLMAQGLHDSIAQGLNFLNLQLQLLDQAAGRGDLVEINDIVPLLRAGVDESYQDVRELLGNFRSRLEQGDLLTAVEATVVRFRRQSGIEVVLNADDLAGPPLPPEQQLQVIFILQEALSNVRKHAHATKVEIKIQNRHDFELSVSDNGVGYDPEEVDQRADEHFGRRIMQERAKRMKAVLELHSSPGQGASIRLLLRAEARQAA